MEHVRVVVGKDNMAAILASLPAVCNVHSRKFVNNRYPSEKGISSRRMQFLARHIRLSKGQTWPTNLFLEHFSPLRDGLSCTRTGKSQEAGF